MFTFNTAMAIDIRNDWFDADMDRAIIVVPADIKNHCSYL